MDTWKKKDLFHSSMQFLKLLLLPFVCVLADVIEIVWLSLGGGGGVSMHIFACINKEILAHAPALQMISLYSLEFLLCSTACRLEKLCSKL